jgi:hypothetical protein
VNENIDRVIIVSEFDRVIDNKWILGQVRDDINKIIVNNVG